ncbi:hypothetical protein L596_028161 [Steinernema carpocapsae]|uniref:Uncharacterized protein n=1 Tax=Steinernema carpocapsae TaxID=34508 RepID=A0A4U5LXP1_STECR|nr:hypothetical protein L596_028161 [Steinernema carpocapsae]
MFVFALRLLTRQLAAVTTRRLRNALNAQINTLSWSPHKFTRPNRPHINWILRVLVPWRSRVTWLMASHLLPLGASSTNASSAVGALPETLVSGVFNSAEAAHQMVTASLFELLIRKPDFKSKFIDPNDPNELLMSTIQMSSGARAPVGFERKSAIGEYGS